MPPDHQMVTTHSPYDQMPSDHQMAASHKSDHRIELKVQCISVWTYACVYLYKCVCVCVCVCVSAKPIHSYMNFVTHKRAVGYKQRLVVAK